jgi:curved DNA-binding protein CbpA
MGTADPGGPGPDLYQLLGVTRSAPREDIVQAWRRRARAEHPDSRPGDAAAPARMTDSPPLWARPVWVGAPPQAMGLDERAEAEVRFAVLAELAARIVFGDRGWPW